MSKGTQKGDCEKRDAGRGLWEEGCREGHEEVGG